MEIRQGRPEDFPVLMDRVVQSFREKNPTHPRFEPLQPDAMDDTPEKMSWWRLAIIDGEIAAGIEVVPQRLRIGDAELFSGGIANVHCWQPYRGHGCMSQLLERCIADMKAAGMCISMLGGDRIRYGHYGWEYAGAQRALSLSAGVVRHEKLAKPATANDFLEYRGDEENAKRMLEAYNQKTARVIRKDVVAFQATMRRPNLVTYINDVPGQFAYVTAAPGSVIAEYAGAAAGIERILRFLLNVKPWTVTLPPSEVSDEIDENLTRYAGYVQMSPSGMVRVNDLTAVLKAYSSLLRRRLACWNGAFTIGVDDGEAVTVTANDGDVSIAPADSTNADVVTSRRELPQLLFGPYMPPSAVLPTVPPVLRLAFPLPLQWSTLDHI